MKWYWVALLPLLVGLAFLLQPRAAFVPVGSTGDQRYVAGFLDHEVTATGIPFRWSIPGAQIWLHGMDLQPVIVLMRTNTYPTESGVLRRVALLRDDQPVVSSPVLSGWRTTYLLLPPAQLTTTLSSPALQLVVDPPITESTDGQQRGIMLTGVGMRLTTLPGIPLAGIATTLLLVVAAAWLMQINRWIFKQQTRQHIIGLAVLLGVIVVVLVVIVQREPQQALWLLPAMPWTIGIGVLGLLWVRLGGQLAGRGRLASVGLLLAGQILMVTQLAIMPGLLLAITGMLLVPRMPLPESNPPTTTRTELGLLAMIVVAALAIRYYRITELPFGMWRDEARHGLAALRMLDDPEYWPVYIASQVELPGLGLRPFAWAMAIWGPQLWSMRMVTALAGGLTVIPLYGLTRMLTGRADLALGAAALLSMAAWSVNLSRFSFPTIFDPLLQLTGLWLLLLGMQQRQIWWRVPVLIAAGSCTGLAMHTYHTGRLAPLVAGVLAVCLLYRNRWATRMRWMLNLGIAGLACLLVAWPLLNYAARRSADFNERVGSVFILSSGSTDMRPPLARLDDSIGRHLLMFNAVGDKNGRHFAPEQALLDPLAGFGLLAGLVLLLRNVTDWRSLAILAGLGLGVAPSLLSVDGPHAMRSIDSLGFACMASVLGFWFVGKLIRQSLPIPARLLVASVALGVVSFNLWLYYVAMPVNRGVWASYYPGQTQVGVYLREIANRKGPQAVEQFYIPAGLYENPVTRYLLYDLKVPTYDDKTLASGAQSGAAMIIPFVLAPEQVPVLQQKYQLGTIPAVVGPMLPGTTRPTFVVYRVP